MLGQAGLRGRSAGSATGDIILGSNWDSSTLNAKINFKLSDPLIKAFFLIDSFLGPGKQGDGSYSLISHGPGYCAQSRAAPGRAKYWDQVGTPELRALGLPSGARTSSVRKPSRLRQLSQVPHPRLVGHRVVTATRDHGKRDSVLGRILNNNPGRAIRVHPDHQIRLAWFSSPNSRSANYDVQMLMTHDQS